MSEFLHIMTLPLLACLILTGIHAYLGFHVIERQVIFVDLALAQIAALGAASALLFGANFDSSLSYWLSLGFTFIGAFILSITRFRRQVIPQEAIIGIVYVVSAALLLMIVSLSGEGDEHIRHVLLGNILLVDSKDILKIFLIYTMIGLFHFFFRKPFFLISKNPTEAFQKGLNVRFWDFLFYISFGLVVTSSVRLAGVLLVFSYLVIPSASAMMFTDNLRIRLVIGWIVGIVASVLGMLLSYYFNFPTGASVICILGLLFALSLLQKIVIEKIS